MTHQHRSNTACQVCGHPSLDPVLFVGHVPPVNTMPAIGSAPAAQEFYPLELLRCPNCTLAQIGFEVDPRVLFPPEYPYRSASTKILCTNFAEQCAQACATLKLGASDLVADIGSNDGTLLANYHQRGIPVLGIEPSDAGKTANERGIRTLVGVYFGADSGRKARVDFGPARLVTACNVFAHIGEPHGVVDGITALLADDGCFISENHYLGGLVETLQYDTIYHEHLRYYSLQSVAHLLGMHGLEVFRVERIPTHGGSIRVWSARTGKFPVEPSVAALLAAERTQGLADGSALRAFARRAGQSKLDLHALLAPLKREGARIVGIGAPSRASTLVCYTGLSTESLDAVLEIASSPKVGRYMPGTRIPVRDETMLFSEQPEYALLLSWHIADELVANLRGKGYRGKFIVPLPEPRILAA